jgi:hypothetical protein
MTDPAVVAQNPTMTVAEAKRIYQAYGDDLEGFYVAMHKALIANRPRVELSNNNYLHALQLTSLMMRNTHKDFQMVSGGTTENFVKMLFTEFRGMLSRLAEVKGKARIIAINSTPVPKGDGLLESLRQQFPGTLEICNGIANDPNRISHFIVADNMVRVERPHAPLNDAANANTVEARVIFNSSVEADIYRRRFDSFWKLVSPVTA